MKYAAVSTSAGEPPIRDVHRDGQQGALDEVAQGRREAVVEDAGPDPVGDLAKLLDGVGDLLDGGVQRVGHRSARLSQLVLEMAEIEADRDQPLLGSVVQVAFDPASLGLGRGHDAAPGVPDLGQLGAKLRAQPHHLDRQGGLLLEGWHERGSCLVAAHPSRGVRDHLRHLLGLTSARAQVGHEAGDVVEGVVASPGEPAVDVRLEELQQRPEGQRDHQGGECRRNGRASSEDDPEPDHQCREGSPSTAVTQA